MRRILVDLKAFAIQYMRNPFGAAFSLGFPVLLLVALGAMFGSVGDTEVHLLLQDQDGTPLSEEFLEAVNATAVNQSGTFVTYMADPNDTIDEEVMRQYNLTATLVIREGFESTIVTVGSFEVIRHDPIVDVVLIADPSHTAYDTIVDAAVASARKKLKEAA